MQYNSFCQHIFATTKLFINANIYRIEILETLSEMKFFGYRFLIKHPFKERSIILKELSIVTIHRFTVGDVT